MLNPPPYLTKFIFDLLFSPQVIDGGDLDINFFIQAPDGKVLISEHKKSDNLHK